VDKLSPLRIRFLEYDVRVFTHSCNINRGCMRKIGEDIILSLSNFGDVSSVLDKF